MIRTLKNFLIGSTVALGLAGQARSQDGYQLPDGFNQPQPTAPAPADTAPVTTTGRGTLDNAYFGLYSHEGRDFARVRLGGDLDSALGDVTVRVLERLGDTPVILGGRGNLSYGKNGIGTDDNEYKFFNQDIRLDAGLRIGSGDQTLPNTGLIPYASIGYSRASRDGDVKNNLETFVVPRAGAILLAGPFQLQAEGGVLLDVGSETNVTANGRELDLSSKGYTGRIQLSLDAGHGDNWGFSPQAAFSLDSVTREITGLRNGQTARETERTLELGGELRAIFYRVDGRGYIAPFVSVTHAERDTDFSFARGRSEDRLLVRSGVTGQWNAVRLGDNWFVFLEARAAHLYDSAADRKHGAEAYLGFGLGHRDSPARREDD